MRCELTENPAHPTPGGPCPHLHPRREALGLFDLIRDAIEAFTLGARLTRDEVTLA